MNNLDIFINRLQRLASSASAEYRSPLLSKVSPLRATFKRQQERFIEFLQLSEEHANKYLHNISAEIQQQKTVLNHLEECLEAAEKLHGEAIDLKMFYESGMAANMKHLRVTGKTVPRCPQRQYTEP